MYSPGMVLGSENRNVSLSTNTHSVCWSQYHTALMGVATYVYGYTHMYVTNLYVFIYIYICSIHLTNMIRK
jgi:hypothetical protein